MKGEITKDECTHTYTHVHAQSSPFSANATLVLHRTMRRPALVGQVAEVGYFHLPTCQGDSLGKREAGGRILPSLGTYFEFRDCGPGGDKVQEMLQGTETMMHLTLQALFASNHYPLP